MDRIEQFVNEYVGFMSINDTDAAGQAELLKEMVKDLLVEDRLRTLNIIEIKGIPLDSQTKNTILGEEINAF